MTGTFQKLRNVEEQDSVSRFWMQDSMDSLGFYSLCILLTQNHPSIRPSVHAFVHRSVRPSIHWSVRPSSHLLQEDGGVMCKKVQQTSDINVKAAEPLRCCWVVLDQQQLLDHWACESLDRCLTSDPLVSSGGAAGRPAAGLWESKPHRSGTESHIAVEKSSDVSGLILVNTKCWKCWRVFVKVEKRRWIRDVKTSKL